MASLTMEKKKKGSYEDKKLKILIKKKRTAIRRTKIIELTGGKKV